MFCKISKLNAIKRTFVSIYVHLFVKNTNNITELALRHDNFVFFCNFALRMTNYEL